MNPFSFKILSCDDLPSTKVSFPPPDPMLSIQNTFSPPCTVTVTLSSTRPSSKGRICFSVNNWHSPSHTVGTFHTRSLNLMVSPPQEWIITIQLDLLYILPQIKSDFIGISYRVIDDIL